MASLDPDGIHSRRRSVSPSGLYVPRDRDRDRSRSRSRDRRVRERSRERGQSRDRDRGFFGFDAAAASSSHSVRRASGSSRHSKSRRDSASGGGFFGLPSVSSRSFFSVFGGGPASPPHSTSYYRRSPRSGFLHKTYRKLRRLLRDLLYYAKKHPFKVFLLAVLPLLTSGALTALLARFGLRLPPALERLLGVGARAARAGGESLSAVGDAAVRRAGSSSGAGAAAAASSAIHLKRGPHGTPQWERRPPVERDYFGGASLARRSASSSNHVPYASSDYYGRPASSRDSHDNSWGATLSRFFS